jgi:predicted  nucleic acid-binding Zn-ribbon protein
MDAGTTRDFIQDLQEENARLHQAIANLCNEMVVLESERDELQRKLDKFGI